MNIKKKISEIVLFTLAVVVGGGYVYYSLFTDTNDSLSKNTTIVINNIPVVGSRTRLGNVSTKKQHKASGHQQNTVSRRPTGTLPPLVAGRSATVSHSTDMLSGSTIYSYSYRAKTPDKTNLSTGGFGDVGLLAFGSRSGRSSGNGLSAQSIGGVMLSEPGATSPFAVPLRPESPTGQNGLILVDPMTDPLITDRIPTGEGWWILLLLAMGYVGWKKNP